MAPWSATLLHALAEDNLAAPRPDLLRAIVKTFADALMSAEARRIRVEHSIAHDTIQAVAALLSHQQALTLAADDRV